MKLGLLDRVGPLEDKARGVIKLHGHDLAVVDLNTGEKVENLVAMLWGPGSMLTHPLQGEDEGLLTPAHVEPDVDYLVVVVRCDAAERIHKRG